MCIKPSLDIVIVNWNSGSFLRECLRSICSACNENFELAHVVVVDNDSSDGSAEGLQFPGLPLTVIKNCDNQGFAAACNQAAKGSGANYLLFLNPDTALLSDSLAAPIQFMQQAENSKIGICGVQLLDETGHVARTCSHFPTPGLLCARMLGLDKLFPRLIPPQFLSENELRFSQTVDQVIGAFMLVRRRLFQELGGFDERFFLYFDDVDLSLRSRQLGYGSYFLSEARACHAENKCTRNVQGTALFYYLRSRIKYSWKHFGTFQGIAVLFATICLEPLGRVVRGIYRGSLAELRETFTAYLKLWRETPRLILKRD